MRRDAAARVSQIKGNTANCAALPKIFNLRLVLDVKYNVKNREV